MTRSDARATFARIGVPRAVSFHALPSDHVDALIAEADRVKYRRPANANGSRARYFHARLMRAADRAER